MQAIPTSSLRASDADREATVERLRVAAVEGRLTPDELDERIGAAYGAKLCADLERLTADVIPMVPRAMRLRVPPPAPVPRLNVLALVSPLAAVFVWWGIGWLVAIVLGHMALGQIHASEGRQYGRRLALLGLSIGYLTILGPLLVRGFWWMTG